MSFSVDGSCFLSMLSRYYEGRKWTHTASGVAQPFICPIRGMMYALYYEQGGRAHMQGSECHRTGGVAGLRSLDRELSLRKSVALGLIRCVTRQHLNVCYY